MSIIIDGKAISKRIRESIKRKVDECKMNGLIPNLSVVLVGEDPASKVYARNKQKACKEVGIKSTVVKLEENTSEQELLEIIYRLNQDNTIHGILVQLPLPNHIDEKRIINAIDLSKDVDGFHPMHSGMLMNGQAILEPCTPKGIIRLIEETKQNIEGKNAVVI